MHRRDRCFASRWIDPRICLISEIKRVAAATASHAPRRFRRGDSTRILEEGKSRMASSGYTGYIGSPDIASRLIRVPGYIRSRFESRRLHLVISCLPDVPVGPTALPRVIQKSLLSSGTFAFAEGRRAERERHLRARRSVSARISDSRLGIDLDIDLVSRFIAAPLRCVLTRYSVTRCNRTERTRRVSR